MLIMIFKELFDPMASYNLQMHQTCRLRIIDECVFSCIHSGLVPPVLFIHIPKNVLLERRGNTNQTCFDTSSFSMFNPSRLNVFFQHLFPHLHTLAEMHRNGTPIFLGFFFNFFLVFFFIFFPLLLLHLALFAFAFCFCFCFCSCPLLLLFAFCFCFCICFCICFCFCFCFLLLLLLLLFAFCICFCFCFLLFLLRLLCFFAFPSAVAFCFCFCFLLLLVLLFYGVLLLPLLLFFLARV